MKTRRDPEGSEDVTVAPFLGLIRLTSNCPPVCWKFAVSTIEPFIVTLAGLFVPE
jgi:hypothetical protein